MIKVGVIGHGGRMGSAVCAAVESDDELDLVARIGRGDSLDGLVASGAEVAVEFTTPDSVADNVRFCIEHAIHAVVGTTGLRAEDVDDLTRRAASNGVGVLIASNFALGAVLMMTFAQKAARYYDAAEIIERHHDKKLDSPSGTALRTASLMNEQRDSGWRVPSGRETVAGSRGGDRGGVRIHSLRLPGSVAHQEVIFGGLGETLTIRHDSLDRSSFMPGVILAVKHVDTLEGVTVSLEHLLEI
jgi:4-hydroxy-tetrahydrodipicolinate reductase